MKRLTERRTAVSAVLVASLTLAAAFAASGAFSAGGSGGPPFSVVSNRGTPFDIPPGLKQRMGLSGYGVIGRLKAANGEHYLRFPAGAHDCFGTGSPTKELPVTVLKCVNDSPFFPSAAKPLLDLSVVEVDANGASSFVRVGGIAADGVAAVGVLNAAGDIAQTIPVVENVFDSTDVRTGTVAALVALDSNGAVIAHEPSVG